MIQLGRRTIKNTWADWLTRHLLLAAVGMACVVHLLAAFHGKRNLDEFQFVINGWDIYRGLAPYRDFWDNHGPLPNYFFSLVFRFWPETHEVFYPLRMTAFFFSLCNAVLTGWAARIAFPQIRYSGRLAAALMLSAPLYLIKAREIRSDTFLMLSWSGALACLLFGLRRQRVTYTAVGGFLCGAALWSTPKGLFIVALGALILAGDSFYRLRPSGRHWLGFSIGALASVTVLAVIVSLLGIHREFFEVTFLQSLGRPQRGSLSAFTSTVSSHPFWMGLAFAAIGQGFAAALRRRRLLWPESLLWAPALFIIVYYFFLLPSRHPQSLLPLHPLIALLGVALLTRMSGFLSAHLLKVRKEWILLAILFGMAVTLLTKTRKLADVRGDFHRIVNYANRLAVEIPPEETVLSGDGLPCFRPAALWYHVLVEDVRRQYALGKARFDIPTALQRRSVRWISIDPRLRTLPPRDLAFFRENYLPVAGTRLGRKRELLVAGKILSLKEEASTVTIALPRHYWLVDDHGREIRLMVDNQLSSHSVYLTAGEHTFASVGSETTVVLSSRWPSRLDWETIQSGLPPVSLRK